MKNTIPVLFSDRLQALRKLHQLSLSKFARNISVSKSMIFNFENQVTSPSVEVLTKISNYFCCSMDYLVGRSDNPYWIDYLPQAEEIFFNHPNTSKDLASKYKHDKATHPIELAPVFLRNYEAIRDNDNQK